MCIRDRRGIPRELLEMARISGASRWQMLTLVELPLALPGIFGGVKSGLALATTGAVVGEFVGAVSYTHLRAHETVLDLVCRLLLEKKNQTKKNNSNTAFTNTSHTT